MTETALRTSSNLDSIKNKIQSKIEDKDFTAQELSELRTELGCLSPDDINALRKLFAQELSAVKTDTRDRLDSLLSECTPPHSEKAPESTKSSFDQVFEGTKSEMLSSANVQLLKDYILKRFEKFSNLSTSERDNLVTATLNKLLVGDALSILLTEMTKDLTDVTSILSRLTSDSAPEKTTPTEKNAPEIEKKANDTMSGIVKKLQGMVDTATTPLVTLLEKTPAPVGLAGFLDNPKEMSKYDGSGNIRHDIIAMTAEDKAEFMKQLHEKVLNIDGQIISLQTLKEKGMNFLSVAPNWVQGVLKWLLESVFGNFLALFLGYSSKKEALAGMGEELRQRKSLMVLRQFGEIVSTDDQGKEQKKPGKKSGEIKILEGQDFSKIDRKKLSPFFEFTKQEGIDMDTKTFWTDIFNSRKIVGKKDETGKETSYVVPEIKADDLKDDFKGLYEKLNSLQKTTTDAKTQATAAADAQKVATEQAKKEKTRVAKVEVQPYKDLYDGIIINATVIKSLKSLNVKSFIEMENGKALYITQAEVILAKNPNKEKIMTVLALYASILVNDKARAYAQGLGNGVNFETLSFQRHKILAQTGRTSEWFQQRTAKIADGKKAEDEAKTVKSEGEKQIEKADCIARRDTIIRDAINRTTVFPVPLPGWDIASIARGKELLVEYPTGVISFDTTKGEIHIGEKKFSLVVKPFTKFGMNITDAKITAIIIKDDHFELAGKSEKWGSGDPTPVSKSEMSELIIALLNGNTDKTKFSDKIAFASVPVTA